MKHRVTVPEPVAVRLLVANQRACCICHERKQVILHHIDGDPSNYRDDNFTVLCLDCHGRVTGDEGLGRRYTEDEVRAHKIDWEQRCAANPIKEEGQAALEVGALVETAAHAKLSPAELEILRNVPSDGRIELLNFPQDPFLRLGPKVVPDRKNYDAASAAHCLDALESLQGRGLARHEGGVLYRLTGRGFDLRRGLLEDQSAQ